MKTSLLFLSILFFNSILFAVPENDTCAEAETLTLTTVNQTINFSLADATINNEIGCEGTTAQNYADLWYEFTMPVDGNVYINGTTSWNRFAIYDECGGNEVVCFDNSLLITDLIEGNSYKLRVFRTEGLAANGLRSFSIRAFEKPENNDCADATNLNVNTETSISINFQITGADINNEIGCEGTTAQNYADLWYEFTMPVDGNLFINGSTSWNQFAIYDECGGDEVVCFDTRALLTDLIEGNSYKLRVFRTEGLAANGLQSFSIRAFETPENNHCTDAATIDVNTETSTSINFQIAGADINSEIGCEGTTAQNYADIWYEFTMPVDGNLFINGSTSWNQFAIYDECGGDEVVCFDTRALLTDLIEGNSYKIRVFRTEGLATNSLQSFSIRAFEKPDNDECVDATTIDVNTETSTSINFQIAGADINNEEGCEGSTSIYLDIWYEFTMPVGGNVLINSGVSWNQFVIYDACGGDEITCFQQGSTVEGLSAGETYLLRVFRTESIATNQSFQNFTIQAYEVVPNDDCVDAEPIVLETESQTLNFSITGANINNEVGCEGSSPTNYADVWYQFEMPFSGDVYINGSIAWNQFAVYDACEGNEIHCSSSDAFVQALDEGETYLLRVFRTESLASNSGFQSFTIQAFENTTNCSSISIWDGTEWSNGLPDENTKAVTNEDYTITESVLWCELEIVAGTFTVEEDAELNVEDFENSLSIKSGGELRVEGVLSSFGDIINDGLITFVSSENATGQMDMFYANLVGTGEVEVQRYIPARRAFRFVSSAVTSTSSIRNNWQEGVNNTGIEHDEDNLDPNPGYGTHISGSSTGLNGFDATASGNPSLFSFDNHTQSWFDVTNTNLNTIEAGTPYRLMVRGDRSVNLESSSSSPTPTVLRTRGSLHTGDYILDESELNNTLAGFSFFGNPYQASVNMTSVLDNSTNIYGFMYVWDPTLGGVDGRGNYVSVDISGGIGNGSNNNPDSAANQYLQPGQAVFVQTLTDAPATIHFDESFKSVYSEETAIFSTQSSISLQLYDAESYDEGETSRDGIRIRFAEEYSNSIDEYDAQKITNQNENLATINGNSLLSIESRSMPVDGEEIPLFVNSYQTTDYVLKVHIEELQGVKTWLLDHYLDSSIELSGIGSTVYPFQVNTSQPASMDMFRFSLLFENETLSTTDFDKVGFTMYPNPSKQGRFTIHSNALNGENVVVHMYNMLGQKVFSERLKASSNSTLEVNATGLSSGMYVVEWVQNGQSFSAKLMVE